jgi:hypothetical protein
VLEGTEASVVVVVTSKTEDGRGGQRRRRWRINVDALSESLRPKILLNGWTDTYDYFHWLEAARWWWWW